MEATSSADEASFVLGAVVGVVGAIVGGRSQRDVGLSLLVTCRNRAEIELRLTADISDQ